MAAKNLGGDGDVWLSRKEAAAYCGVSISSIRAAEHRGELRVRKVRGAVRLISRRALDDWRTRVGRSPDSMREAAEAVAAGAAPRELVQLLGCTPERAQSFVESMRWLSGAWIIEGPAGSRDAWLRAYGYDNITPHQLRRALELAACIPGLRALVRGEPSYKPGTACVIGVRAERSRRVAITAAVAELGYNTEAIKPGETFDRTLRAARDAELAVFIDPSIRHASSKLWATFGALCERVQWSSQRVVLLTSRASMPAMPVGVHVIRSLDELALFVRVRNSEHAA